MGNINCILLFWPNYIKNKNINRELKDDGIKSFFFDIYERYMNVLKVKEDRRTFINAFSTGKNTSLFYTGIGEKEKPESRNNIWNEITEDNWYKILNEEAKTQSEKKLIKIRLNINNSSLKRLFCWWVTFEKDDWFIDVLFPIEYKKTK